LSGSNVFTDLGLRAEKRVFALTQVVNELNTLAIDCEVIADEWEVR